MVNIVFNSKFLSCRFRKACIEYALISPFEYSGRISLIMNVDLPPTNRGFQTGGSEPRFSSNLNLNPPGGPPREKVRPCSIRKSCDFSCWPSKSIKLKFTTVRIWTYKHKNIFSEQTQVWTHKKLRTETPRLKPRYILRSTPNRDFL